MRKKSFQLLTEIVFHSISTLRALSVFYASYMISKHMLTNIDRKIHCRHILKELSNYKITLVWCLCLKFIKSKSKVVNYKTHCLVNENATQQTRSWTLSLHYVCDLGEFPIKNITHRGPDRLVLTIGILDML